MVPLLFQGPMARDVRFSIPVSVFCYVMQEELMDLILVVLPGCCLSVAQKAAVTRNS